MRACVCLCVCEKMSTTPASSLHLRHSRSHLPSCWIILTPNSDHISQPEQTPITDESCEVWLKVDQASVPKLTNGLSRSTFLSFMNVFLLSSIHLHRLNLFFFLLILSKEVGSATFLQSGPPPSPLHLLT